MLLIDFETYCELDLRAVGGYRYCDHPSFEALLMSYTTPGSGEVFVAQGEEEILAMLYKHSVFGGWGQFDRLVLRRLLGEHARFVYEDVMVRAAEVGYPLKLELAAKMAGLETGKLPGSKLITLFCKPNRKCVRHGPEHPKWADFIAYARQDTVVLDGIYTRTPELDARERALYELDVEINTRGMRVDLEAVEALRRITFAAEKRLDEIVSEATGGVVTSVSKLPAMRRWAWEKHHVKIDSLTSDAVQQLLLDKGLPAPVRTVLRARQAGAKASTKKLARFHACAGYDGRIRGMLQFCGAHTRRWAGRLVQPQNLPRNCYGAEAFEEALAVIREGKLARVASELGSPLLVVSKMLRGLFVPAPGHVFLVADYSAIEARILAWLAGQHDVLDIYHSGGDVYVAMAASVFRVREEDVTPAQRFLGKTLVLGCGYMLGAKKLRVSLALAGVEVSEEVAGEYIAAFRTRYGKVVGLWEDIRSTIMDVVRAGKHGPIRAVGDPEHEVQVSFRGGALVLLLPNGAKLYYHGARIDKVPTPWDPKKTMLAVTARMRVGNAVSRRPLSPGLITENIVQALAREVLGAGMLRSKEEGFPIVLTAHDEVIAEVEDEGEESNARKLEAFSKCLVAKKRWMKGLPLDVESEVMSRYGK